MAQFTLELETGRATGSGPARRLRVEDRIPGVLYGEGVEPTSVTVGRRDLRAALHTEAGMNALLTLKLSDGGEQLALIRELQRDPVKRKVLHVDFLAIDRNKPIRVDVPVVTVGESEKVQQAEGGTIDQLAFTLHVLSLPNAIPNEITVDVSEMDIGDTIRIGDLQLPEGVTTDVDPEEPVVSAKIVQEVVLEPEPVEGEEAEGEEAEGEGAEAAADGEGEGDAAEGGEDSGDEG